MNIANGGLRELENCNTLDAMKHNCRLYHYHFLSTEMSLYRYKSFCRVFFALEGAIA